MTHERFIELRKRIAAKRGDIDQMSFAFTVEREEWNEGTQTRTILQVRDLYDIADKGTGFDKEWQKKGGF